MCIEEPMAPDDSLEHAAIRRAPSGNGVPTGEEHAHNRLTFKQLFLDIAQIDQCVGRVG